MPRPRVRTARVTEDERRELKEQFGTIQNAYARLMPGGTPLAWAIFRIIAAGGLGRPEHVATLRKTVAEWKKANLRK